MYYKGKVHIDTEWFELIDDMCELLTKHLNKGTLDVEQAEHILMTALINTLDDNITAEYERIDEDAT